MKTGMFSESRQSSLFSWSLGTLRLSCDVFLLFTVTLCNGIFHMVPRKWWILVTQSTLAEQMSWHQYVTPRCHYAHFGIHLRSLSPSGYIAHLCTSWVAWVASIVIVAMVTKRSVFSESPPPTFYRWSILLFSVSRTVFELFVFFACNVIFLSRRQVYPFWGPGPGNYEFIARKPQKATCTNWIAPFGREKWLSGALSDR